MTHDAPALRTLNTQLIDALINGYPDSAHSALERGASPSAIDDRLGGSALFWAAAFDQPTVVARLIAAGVEIDHPRRCDGSTALMGAASNETDECLRLLLAAGADPFAQNLYGRTALLEAAGERSLPCCRLLAHTESQRLAHPDSLQTTPLIEAADFGEPALLHFLLTVSDPLAVNSKGLTALMQAALGCNVEALLFLAPLSGDLNRADAQGNTPWSVIIDRFEDHQDDDKRLWLTLDAMAALGVAREHAIQLWRTHADRMPRFSALQERTALLGEMPSFPPGDSTALPATPSKRL